MNYQAKVIHQVRAVPKDRGDWELVSIVMVDANRVIERVTKISPAMVENNTMLDNAKRNIGEELLNDETVKRAIRGSQGDRPIVDGS